MIGVCGSVEVRLVARVTSGWSVGVVIVGVALRAGERGVSASQRVVGIESVIEVHVRPVSRCVAGFACSGEPSGSMTWVGRAVPIGLVTAEAVCGERRVVVVGVALHASHRGVGPG